MAARARLYERMAHDPGPWGAIVHAAGQPGAVYFTELSYPMTLDRHVCGDRIVLTGYMPVTCPDVRTVDIWCRGDMLVSWPVSPPTGGPVRISFDIGIEAAEQAA